jgi:hypothetical protein
VTAQRGPGHIEIASHGAVRFCGEATTSAGQLPPSAPEKGATPGSPEPLFPIAHSPGVWWRFGYLASTFLVGDPQTPKSPGFTPDNRQLATRVGSARRCVGGKRGWWFCSVLRAVALPAPSETGYLLWGPIVFLGSQIQRHVRGARGMSGSNESTATTREAWLCCLLIRARRAATPGHVVVARPQQL